MLHWNKQTRSYIWDIKFYTKRKKTRKKQATLKNCGESEQGFETEFRPKISRLKVYKILIIPSH